MSEKTYEADGVYPAGSAYYIQDNVLRFASTGNAAIGAGAWPLIERAVLAKRDDELGRWRSPDYPDWFAVHDADVLRVCNERMLRVWGFNSVETTYNYSTEDTIATSVARHWYAEHEQAKPWLKAEPGEVWELTLRSPSGNSENLQGALVNNENRFVLRDTAVTTRDVPLAWDRIKTARRIWPEEAK